MEISRKELWRREQFDRRYFIYGKELYLVERCLQKIREQAATSGYSERVSMDASVDFRWATFTEQTAQSDLFGGRKLVELRLPSSGRPGTQGAKILTECVKSPSDDVAVVLIGGGMETAVRRMAWFKTWLDQAVAVDNPELRREEFSTWIKNVLQRDQLSYEPDVVGRLAYYFEGNMLAAGNEMQKLALGDDGSTITVEEIDRIVADQAKFNVFAFVDGCLTGRARRALRQLRLMKNEGAEPLLILWALARELRIVYRLTGTMANRQRTQPIFNEFRIWRARQDVLMQAAKRIGHRGSIVAMRQLARADRILKGREPADAGNIWNQLENIVLYICGIRTGVH